jgi:hypothetical protein
MAGLRKLSSVTHQFSPRFNPETPVSCGRHVWGNRVTASLPHCLRDRS